MDLDAYFSENPMGGAGDDVDEGFRSGFVALVGRPNAGKSTLMNKVVGSKVAITSRTSQTTRQRIRAVLNGEGYQLVLVDTPGLHKPKDVLGEELNASATKALDDVDVVAMLVDCTQPIGRGDEWVAAQVAKCKARRICVLSKADLATPEQVEAQRAAAERLGEWDAMVLLSAKTGRNVDAFVEECVFLLPEGPRWFPADMLSDQTDESMVAELVREKVLRSFRDEVPHSVGVKVDSMEYVRKKQLYRIEATVLTERDSQKAMLIGKGGRAIKRIGSQARSELETMFGARVYLELSVKVKRNWRSDEAQLRAFGYME